MFKGHVECHVSFCKIRPKFLVSRKCSYSCNLLENNNFDMEDIYKNF